MPLKSCFWCEKIKSLPSFTHYNGSHYVMLLNLETTSGLLILLHGVISLTDTTSHDKCLSKTDLNKYGNHVYKKIIFEGLRKLIYQSPLISTELFQHNLIKVSYLTACYLYQVMMTLHFLNDVANDAESHKNKK